MRALLAVAAMAATLASAPRAAGEEPAGGPSLRVVAAGALIGERVRDRAGEAAGEVAAVLIDTVDARARWVMVASGGVLGIGEALAAVPWQVVDFGRGGREVRVRVDKQALVTAPKVDRDRLVELADPARMGGVLDYYAAVAAAPRDAPPPEGPADRRARSEWAGVPTLVVSRQGITTLMPPAATDEPLGDRVRSAAGEEVGRIDELVVEAETGRVAYALLARGGFLGLGEQWAPIPFPALAWSPVMRSYTLARGLSPARMQGFPRQRDLPAAIGRGQLAQLYRLYGVRPYWE